MSGLYALLLVGLWCWLLGWLSWRFAKPRFKPGTNGLVAFVVFLLFLPLPLADEIVGAVQMHRLCEANAKFRLGVADPAGRTTRYVASPSNEDVSGTAIRILHSRIAFVDVDSGEPVLEYDEYDAAAGLFVNAFFWAEMTRSPLIGRGSCTPISRRRESPHKTFGFNVVN